jgi:hypothetical protein
VTARRLPLVAAPLVAVALVGALPSPGANRPVGPVVKTALIPSPILALPGSIRFSPTKVRRGTVTFSITNTDNDVHVFSINGVQSRWIRPMHTAKLTVTFKRPGRYIASCPDSDSPFAGLLTVT